MKWRLWKLEEVMPRSSCLQLAKVATVTRKWPPSKTSGGKERVWQCLTACCQGDALASSVRGLLPLDTPSALHGVQTHTHLYEHNSHTHHNLYNVLLLNTRTRTHTLISCISFQIVPIKPTESSKAAPAPPPLIKTCVWYNGSHATYL